MKRSVAGLLVSLFVLIGILNGCGGDDSSSSNPLSVTMGAIAVTSPTARTSSSSASFWKADKAVVHAALQFTGLSFVLEYFGFFNQRAAVASDDIPTTIKPLNEMINEVKANQTNAASAAADVGNLVSKDSFSAKCFGPAWTDDATGASQARPSGDLGLVANVTKPGDTEACSAGQLNALLAGAPMFANKVINVQAALVAAFNAGGKPLPAEGEEVDGLATIPSFTGITVTNAKLKKISNDASGDPRYKTSFGFTANGKTGSIIVYHTNKNGSNTEYSGLIQAILPYSPTSGSGTKRGLSMIYEKDAAGNMTYALDQCANQTVSSIDFFNTSTGRINMSSTACGEDMSRIIAQFNESNNLALMYYAWQAGSGDGATRTFAVNIPAGTTGALTGTSYFGFSSAMTSLTDNVSTFLPSKMYCNWINGGSGGASIVRAQKQTMTQSSGKFIPASNSIDFAPDDDCQANSWTISNNTDYAGTRNTATHSLVTVPTLGDLTAVTVPTVAYPSGE